MTPQEPKGEQASADAGVEVAIRMLEHSLVAHTSGTDKGKALMHAISSLRKAFKTESGEQIMPAELKAALMQPAGEPGPAGAPGGAAPAPPQAGAM
jgi:hypothetical protein